MNLSSLKKPAVRNAIMLGGLCSLSYLGVYFARNILGAVTPQIIADGVYTTEYIGEISSLYFMFYACGQLINGIVGDKVKARYMLSFGLILAGVCNMIFPYVIDNKLAAQLAYGMTGFFLSMIWAPMSKVVAENTEPIYTTRCTLGFTVSSFLGSPIAGVFAALFVWQSVFTMSSISLLIMGAACFAAFLVFERKGIVKYNQYSVPKEKGNGIKVLIKHRIIKFTFISILTGVVRTAVVFWLPTYISQYLGFTPKTSALIFTVASFIMSASAFIAVFIYERLKHNMDLTLFISFAASTIGFIAVYFVHQPIINIILMIFAIMSSDCASSMMWSRYCPSLRDTGMVSSATGYLDFVSYMAAAAATTLFANAVESIGWGNLILVWFALMAVGFIITFPRKAKN